jgi:RNA polymerase sigma factor (sigma-70 family)
VSFLVQPAANASNAIPTTKLFTLAPRYAGFEVARRMLTIGGEHDQRFEAVYRKHYARVWRYYRSCRVADDEAHDLAQDTFKRFYERMAQIRGSQEWPFLDAIARSVLLNWLRAAKTAKRSAIVIDINDPDIGFEPEAPPERDFADRQEDARRRKQLKEAVADLPEGQRQCLRLSLQGFKYEEISKILGITIDAVKSRLRDAKKELRERLGGKS